MDIGRYTITIFVFEVFIDPEAPRNGALAFDGEGELVIEDVEVVLPPNLARTGRRPASQDPESVVEAFFEPMTNLAQFDCFGTSTAVPASPENLGRAIQWCSANQAFMKDGGV